MNLKFAMITIVVGALFLAGIAGYVIRTVPHTPIEKWHLDPTTAETPSSPNTFRAAPESVGSDVVRVDMVLGTYSLSPKELARTLEAHVIRQRDTIRIAGSPNELWLTYVQRSERMRFPDYISVMTRENADGQTEIAIFSRSRFGYGDMGVNEARVRDYVSVLADYAN